MRNIIQGAAAAAMACSIALAGSAFAQTYPRKPVRVIVPYPPGSSYDTVSRIVGEALAGSLKQPFVIDNRTGASGTIGVNLLARAAPDGHTLGVFGNNQTIVPAVSAKPPYDLLRDVVPLARIALIDSVIVATPSLPAQNLREMIALLKANPGKYRYGSGGIASSSHLMGAMFTSLAGVELLHVPYKGGSAGLTALIGNEVQMQITALVGVKPLVQSGKLRGIAIASRRRSPHMPELPTTAEAGLPGYEFVQWFGVFTTPGTPAAVISRLSVELKQTMARPEVRARITAVGGDPYYEAPADFSAFIARETAANRKVAREANIRLD